jgi:hypothetical protein
MACAKTLAKTDSVDEADAIILKAWISTMAFRGGTAHTK